MPAPQSGVYSFLSVGCAISGPGGSITISTAGMGEGGIRISMVGDKNRMSIGSAGDIMHSLIASNSARITVSLLKTAIGNSLLNELYRYQKQSPAYWGQNVIALSDPTRGEFITASFCAFVKQTDLIYSSEGGMNEWAFDSGSIDEVLGSGTTNQGV